MISVDLSFLTSALLKVPTGGYVPLIIATVSFFIMFTWKWGKERLHEKAKKKQEDLKRRNTNAEVEGTLTLLGKTRPFRFSVTEPDPGQYRGSAALKQSDFGVTPYSSYGESGPMK